jgi:UDP-N-acetylmuramyl pentapeptide phosphotransferase/UDP-N-acetylglucosamine-1-phosphate transferase
MIGFLIILSFFFSFLGTFIVKYFAAKKNIMDIPNIRSSHVQPTPRGGGLAISLAWFVGIIVLLLFRRIPESLFASLLCGIPITLIGLVDDIVTISPKLRLLVQLIFASLAVYFLQGLNFIDLGFAILDVPLLFNILAVLGIVWFINLFNFLDGIDGYISTEIIFICLGASLVTGTKLPLLLAAATSGFLILNWQPAKIFMGDVGSTFLGFTIAIFLIYYQNANESSVIIWLMLSSLFWYDATITLIRRWRNHEQLSKAHKKHAYQRIIQYGFSHQKTVIYSVFINVPILGLTFLAHYLPAMALLFFVIDIIYLFFVMKMVDKKFPFQYN